MNRFCRSLFALGLTLILPIAAIAADNAAPKKAETSAPSPDYSEVLKLFKSQGVTITYLDRQYGLDGWLLTKDGKIQVVYVTTDGKGAVVGTMYGPDGNLITGAQLAAAKTKGTLPASITGAPAAAAATPAALTPAADTTAKASTIPPGAAAAEKSGEAPSERLWKQVESSTYIKIGPDSAPPFYVIMDPRCEYCQKLFTELSAKYLPSNAVQLRVIPVGILGPDSIKEANQVVSAPAEDSAKLWTEIEHHNIADLPQAAPDSAAKTEKNHQIMSDWNLTGTPACIYRTKDGKVKVVLGVPNDLDDVISNLGPGKS